MVFFPSYQTAHLWSNGPRPGEDLEYIFQRRPESQENLPPEALLGWYKKTLEKAEGQGVIVGFDQKPFELDSIHTDMPYFKGDIWPRRLDAYCKALDSENFKDEYAEELWSRLSKKAAKVNVILLL